MRIHSINFACSKYHHLPSPFPGKQLKAIATAQIWLKNKNGSLHLHGGFHVINLNARVYFVTLSRHLTESYTFLSGKPERNSSTSMRNNTYLLTLRANCATICQMRKDTTPTRPQLISSDYFVFLQESLAKVLTSRSAPFSKARFQNKN